MIKKQLKINFLTTRISNETGGSIYDSHFFSLLKSIYPDVCLYDDAFFVQRYKQGSNLLMFNGYYRKSIQEIFGCDYLILNSRLYTRFVFINIKKIKKYYPNLRIIVIHHHNNFQNHSGVLHFIHKLLEFRILKNATDLVIPNEYVADYLDRRYGLKNIVFLKSSFIGKSSEKQLETITKRNKQILFVGTIERRKGIIYGLKAFKLLHKKYPEYSYIIVGNYNKKDGYFRKLYCYVRRNNLNEVVIFKGRVDDNTLRELYKSSEFFLFPSLLEGYGFVILEAMSWGLPVVAFNNSAMPYTINHDENGLLIKNKDYKDMAKQISFLLDDEKKMRQLRNGALFTYGKIPVKDEILKVILLYIQSWK